MHNRNKISINYPILFLLIYLFSGLQGYFFPIFHSFSPLYLNEGDPLASGNIKPNESVIDEISIGTPSNYPLQGVINSSSHHIFWFLQISDTQMIWTKWGTNERRPLSDSRVIKMRTFLNTTQKIIAPLFIVNTGDLVDSAYESYFYRTQGQKIVEWEYYNETMQEFGMNSTYYFDMIGNHDIYRNPGFTYFLNYSVSGSAFKTDQYMFTAALGFGNYSFYTLSTPEDNGLEFPFALGGVLSTSELDWFQGKLEKYHQLTNRTFAFGHHPIDEIYSQKTSTGKSFEDLLAYYNVDMYLFGHGHENKFDQFGATVAYETAKIDEDEGTYRIIAVDNDGIATTEQAGNLWPAGLITAPTDTRNTRTEEDMQRNAALTKIRALAWDPSAVQSVECRFDKREQWIPMNHVEGPLYESDFDSSLKDGKQHIIEIRITNFEGKQTIKSITFRSTIQNFRSPGTTRLWLVGFLVAVSIVPSTVMIYLRKKNPVRYRKQPYSVVQKEQAKRVLFKFIGLICLPISFGLMYAENITALFAFFLVGLSGIMYSDTTLIFSAVLLIWIPLQSLCLSEKHKMAMRIITRISIFFELFFFTLFMLHYPTIAWLSPGIYIALYFDTQILRTSKNN